jgi:hypothetical protein
MTMLTEFPHAFSADSLLCCIGQFEDDIQPYLNLWKPDESRSAALHFADFIRDNAIRRPFKDQAWKLSNAFWKDRREQMKPIIDWLVSPEQTAALERAFFSIAKDDCDAANLSEAAERLQVIRSQYGSL